ncbi:MAG: hydroxymethylglutaryl-CoA lyase [Clostridiales bacterium]|jgi:hydroxymethylglutaryl-CoA lyase|nr:hydroxymethylglutaryl-CoA lyase [Clostridiales bacterium]
MGKKVEIYEVGPRDGFQSVSCGQIPTGVKIDIIGRIVESGVKHIEYTSFVSPKAIPQLADAAEVTRAVMEKYPEIDLFPLVPNKHGAGAAYNLGLRRAVNVVSLSASHNKANINRTHEQSLNAYIEIKQAYPDLDLIIDLATAFGCPFEGKFNEPEKVAEFLVDYVEAGMTTCCLCDTVGIADPAQTKALLSILKNSFPNLDLMVHFHDTRGAGLANTLTSIEMGVNKVQAALGGLGGCPFAPGASGNLSSEDLVWILNEMGYETEISFESLLSAAKYQAGVVQGAYSGHQINIQNK